MNKSSLELSYLNCKTVLESLRRHAKIKRDELNDIAQELLGNSDEYIFSTGSLVIKRPSNHTTTKIKGK